MSVADLVTRRAAGPRPPAPPIRFVAEGAVRSDTAPPRLRLGPVLVVAGVVALASALITRGCECPPPAVPALECR